MPLTSVVMLLDSTFHFQTLEVPVVPIPDLRDLYLYLSLIHI